MKAEFWHERWRLNEIGFHENSINKLLLKHFNALALGKDARIFVPLCGKSRDMLWLLSQGYKVVGVELSEIAVTQFFNGNSIAFTKTAVENFKCYDAEGISILVGDVFQLRKQVIGKVNAIYDRAALVALPENMRKDYTNLLRELTDSAPQLVISFVYDQGVMAGPPFSISDAEMKSNYGSFYKLKLLESVNVEGGLKGLCPAVENAWLLT